MQAKERKITLNRQGQSALKSIETACLDCARYGLEVGDAESWMGLPFLGGPSK